MDDNTRGDIEHMIDEIMEEISPLNPDICWIFDFKPEPSKTDFLKPISKPDFLLGYILGRMYTQAWQIMVKKTLDKEQDFQELEDIIKRRLPEIQSNISFALNL